MSESQNHETNALLEMRKEMYDLTDRFLTADTLEESIVNKESVKNAIYSDYYEIFYNITNITTKLNYLTHGDISFEEANETTYKLLKLIKYIPEVNLKLSEEKKIEIPEKSSFLYSYKSQNHKIYTKYKVEPILYMNTMKLLRMRLLFILIVLELSFGII